MALLSAMFRTFLGAVAAIGRHGARFSAQQNCDSFNAIFVSNAVWTGRRLFFGVRAPQGRNFIFPIDPNDQVKLTWASALTTHATNTDITAGRG